MIPTISNILVPRTEITLLEVEVVEVGLTLTKTKEVMALTFTATTMMHLAVPEITEEIVVLEEAVDSGQAWELVDY